MPGYVRIVHRGRGQRVRVLLPDGNTQLVDVNDLPNWYTVPLNEGVEDYVPTRTRNRLQRENFRNFLDNLLNNSEGTENSNAESENNSENDSEDDTVESENREYIRILHRGRGFNTRVLLPDGNTRLVPTSELDQWTCVGDNTSVNVYSSRFVNPENQEDRIYTRVLHNGSRNTRVELPNGETIRVPNDILQSTWLRKGSRAYDDWRENILYANGRSIDDITFGVELEFIADSHKYNDFVSAMNFLLGQERFDDPMRYSIHSTEKWLLKTDNSVQNTDSNNSNYAGYELTSPILKWNSESKEELSQVLHIITDVFGGKINKTCGTHIHIGNFAHITGDSAFYNKIVNFQRNYGYYENSVFDRVTAPSRRRNENRFCQSCNNDSIPNNEYGGRYFKVNIRNLYGFGTIENRQHSGTLELKKIWYWVELNGKYILEYLKNPEKFTFFINEQHTLDDFLEKVNLSEEGRTFFRERAQKFSRNNY